MTNVKICFILYLLYLLILINNAEFTICSINEFLAVFHSLLNEKINQNMSFLAFVKAFTDMSDCISSCSLNTINKSEHHTDKKHNL